MSMVLEYPFRIFILIVVVIIIIGIMWQFRDRIMEICLFPPCDEEECNIQPVISDENRFTEEVLDKYCSQCWIKNGEGKCKGDSVCDVLNLGEEFDFDSPTAPWLNKHDYCIVTCKDVTSTVYVQYLSLERMIEIAC